MEQIKYPEDIKREATQRAVSRLQVDTTKKLKRRIVDRVHKCADIGLLQRIAYQLGVDSAI